jgi:hypothetical protein
VSEVDRAIAIAKRGMTILSPSTQRSRTSETLPKPRRPVSGRIFRQPADVEVAWIPSPLVDRPTAESDGERIGTKGCAAGFGPRHHTPNLFAILLTQIEVPDDPLGVAAHRFPGLWSATCLRLQERARYLRNRELTAIFFEVYGQFVPDLRAGDADLDPVTGPKHHCSSLEADVTARDDRDLGYTEICAGLSARFGTRFGLEITGECTTLVARFEGGSR